MLVAGIGDDCVLLCAVAWCRQGGRLNLSFFLLLYSSFDDKQAVWLGLVRLPFVAITTSDLVGRERSITRLILTKVEFEWIKECEEELFTDELLFADEISFLDDFLMDK